MKGAGTLASLIGVAILAGVLLVNIKPAPEAPPEGETRSALELYVEEILGLQFQRAPEIRLVDSMALRTEIQSSLEEQFGPSGLARRSRALELIGFREFRHQTLNEGLLALQSVGVRGWLNDSEEHILVPLDFDEEKTTDRVILQGLLARLLTLQHTPKTIGTLPDDEWIARRGLQAAIGESVEANLRETHRTEFELPTALITEREALLASLPIYVAALGELPQQNGPARNHLETRIRTGARALTDLIADPPRSTFELLGGDPSSLEQEVRIPTLDKSNSTQLESSLGALAIQTLVEWLDSYEQAQALALLWRSDRYRLFANTRGDHLIWVCQWATPEAAARAAQILSRRQEKADDLPRAFSVAAYDRITVLANCADDETLQTLTNLRWASSVDHQVPASPR